MANSRLREASERITTYQLGPHFAHLNLPPHSWAGGVLLTICSLLLASSSSESWSPVTCGTGGGQYFAWCLRAGRTRHCGYSSPECAAGVPSDAGRRLRPDRDRDHRRRIHARARLLNRMTDESMEVDHGQEDRRHRHQRAPLLLGAGFTAAGGGLMARFDTDNTAT